MTVTSLTDRTGGSSSSVIVPSPEPSASVAFVGGSSSTVNVSDNPSSMTSPLTAIVIVRVSALPASKVSEPLAVAKSSPPMAVPFTVEYPTVTGSPLTTD